MSKGNPSFFLSLLLSLFVNFNADSGVNMMNGTFNGELRAHIIGDVFINSGIRDNLSVLCNEIGGRVSGTAPGDQAQEFTLQKFTEYGLDKVQLEPFDMLGWQRISLMVSVVSPKEKVFSGVALANTPSTPAGGITAQVIDVGTGHPKEFADLGEEVKGKIALVSVGSLPGERWIHRSEKMTLSMKYGAVGMLLRTTVTGDLPRTGTCQYGKLSSIPGIGISKEDGDWLLWMMQKGEKVVVNIQMDNRVDQVTAANVVGEIRGGERPEEIVIVGAHLDSWDLGTGAVDNGTGSAIVLETARVLAGCGQRPKRTLRFVLFMGEEMGLVGSKAYVAQHHEELDRIVTMMNLDMVGTPYGYRVHGHEEMIPFLTKLARSLEGLGMDPENITDRVSIYGDYEPFMIEGVPTMTVQTELENEMGRYYHTSGDTYDKLDFTSLHHCAAVVAVTLMEIANAKERVGERLSLKRVEEMLIEKQYKEPLQLQGGWPFGSTHE